MVSPVVQALKSATHSLLIPTSTSSVSPIPTVLPGSEPVYEMVGDGGKKTLWVVFVIMVLSSLAFYAMAWSVPVQKRLFHVITAIITTFAAISYFAMATGDGNSLAVTVIKESHKHVPDTVEYVYRQVFWARYVDWTLTTPLLLLDLAFLAGLNGAEIFVAIVADLVMVLTGLFAAFGHSEGQKWGYYAMAIIAYLIIIYELAIPGRRSVSGKDNQTAKLFASIGAYTLVLWTLYPIVWGLGEGARVWSVDAEIMAYAVLDVLAKPVFGFWLLFAHGRKVQSLDGFWSTGLGSEGHLRVGDDE